MKRKLFNVAAVLSLLICLATLVLWRVSYLRHWSVDFGAPLHNGSVERSTDWASNLRSGDGLLHLTLCCSFYSWDKPYWKLAALFTGLPVWWAVREFQRGNATRAEGKCRRCGYDLRATPERCPECGQVPESPTA